MAASQAACEAIWMRNILVGLFGSHLDPIVIYCDNHSFIKLSLNPVFHDRSKHIYPVSSSRRLCVAEDHVSLVHSYERSGCRHFDEGTHQKKI
jgi:hypothetical protein